MGSFIRNLRFAHKFLLIAVLAALMLAVPTVIFVQAHLADIATAKKEVSGLEPIQAVMTLTQLTQQHRGLSAGVLAGNEAQAAARQALATAHAALVPLGSPPLLELATRITQDWKALSGAVAAKSLAGP